MMAEQITASELPPRTAHDSSQLRDVVLPPGQIWDTSNQTYFDLWRRRVATLMLMKRIYYRLKSCEQETAHMAADDPANERCWNEAHVTNAREMRDHAEFHKGLLIKAGQFMSSLGGTLPDAYPEGLMSLTDHLPISLPAEVYKTIETDIGLPPHKVFERFDPVPIASASVAQVHKAQLCTGIVKGGDDMIVAVKIQHDGVDRVFLEDASTLNAVCQQVFYWAPSWDFRKIAEEWSESLPRELDLKEECRALEIARAALDRADVPVVIPRAFPDLVSKRVLIMEFVEAQPIMRLSDPAFCATHRLDKRKVLGSLLDAFGITTFRGGIFHADPHPGNVRIVLDPSVPGGARPVLFDWGLFRELDTQERLGLAKVFHALANFDVAGVFDGMSLLGFLVKRELLTDEFRREILEQARGLMKDTTTKQQARAGVQREYLEHKERSAHFSQRDSKHAAGSMNPLWFLDTWPRVIVMFGRMLQILRGLCTSMDADQMPVLQIFTRHARNFLWMNSLSPLSSPYTLRASPSTRLQARLQACLERLLTESRIVGAQVAVLRDGVCVVDACAGTLSTIDARPVAGSTCFPLLGATGGVSALALLRTIYRQDGVSASDALRTPLTDVWPEFRCGESSATIADLLSHRAGLRDSFPDDFGARHLDRLLHVLEHLENVPPAGESSEPRYAYPLQAFALAKVGLALTGQDSLLHWIGGELEMDIAAPTHDSASVSRDLPQLARVSLNEVEAGRQRRRGQFGDRRGVSTPRGEARKSVALLDAVVRDPTTFDPIQANYARGAQFRGGLALGASAMELASMLSRPKLHAELKELGALKPMPGGDYTALGWLLAGGASRWTAGGLQILDLKGRGARRLVGRHRQGYGVVCGFGPSVCHFPDIAEGGLTVAVTVNNVLTGRGVAAELIAEVLSGFGYAPAWPSIPVRVMADAAKLVRSPQVAPLVANVGGLGGILAGGGTASGSRLRRLSCCCGCFGGCQGCCGRGQSRSRAEGGPHEAAIGCSSWHGRRRRASGQEVGSLLTAPLEKKLVGLTVV